MKGFWGVLGQSWGGLWGSWVALAANADQERRGREFKSSWGSSWTLFRKVFRCLFVRFFHYFLILSSDPKFQKWSQRASVSLTFRPSTSMPFQVFQGLVKPCKSGQVLKAFPNGQATTQFGLADRPRAKRIRLFGHPAALLSKSFF